jgi:ferredoxin
VLIPRWSESNQKGRLAGEAKILALRLLCLKDDTHLGRRPCSEDETVDPVECIDCGACVPVCPVSAIFALDDLPEKWKQCTELNESYVKAAKFTPEDYAKHQVK